MTMPAQPTAPSAPSTSAPSPAPIVAPARSSAESRASKLKADLGDITVADALKQEGIDVDGGGDTASAPPARSPAPGQQQAPAGGEPDAVAKARQERQQRLAQMRERERAADVDRKRHEQHRDQTSEMDKLRARLSELEPLNQVFDSEESLLAFAEKKGMSSERIVKFLRDRLSDPAAIAARQSKTEADKVREELAKERAEREALAKRIEDERKQTQEAATGQQKAHGFIGNAARMKDSHPLTARLLERDGAQGLITFANHFIAPHLRPDYSLEELHDSVEQFLEDAQLGSGNAPAAAPPANGPSHQAPPKKNGAAEPSTTLSNALTSERTAITEEVPLHRLSKKERERRLREQLERE